MKVGRREQIGDITKHTNTTANLVCLQATNGIHLKKIIKKKHNLSTQLQAIKQDKKKFYIPFDQRIETWS